jgi:hypothetical protein
MSLNFMKPDIWDGIVLGTVLIGLALAILRVMSDRAAYKLEQELERRKAEQQTGGVDDVNQVDNHHQEE